MAPTPSLLVKYSVPNRDGVQTVTNRYHFSGGLPGDSAHWTTFADEVVDNLKTMLHDETTITDAIGYDAVADVAVFGKTYAVSGTQTIVSGTGALPGFCCALLKWATSARTKKNHPIYLFSYVHGVPNRGLGAPDCNKLSTLAFSEAEAYAEKWWNTGFTDGVHVYRRAGPNGVTAISSTVDEYIRDHDLSPR